eukprot:3345008-Amphidinium_carterae.1
MSFKASKCHWHCTYCLSPLQVFRRRNYSKLSIRASNAKQHHFEKTTFDNAMDQTRMQLKQ